MLLQCPARQMATKHWKIKEFSSWSAYSRGGAERVRPTTPDITVPNEKEFGSAEYASYNRGTLMMGLDEVLSEASQLKNILKLLQISGLALDYDISRSCTRFLWYYFHRRKRVTHLPTKVEVFPATYQVGLLLVEFCD